MKAGRRNIKMVIPKGSDLDEEMKNPPWENPELWMLVIQRLAEKGKEQFSWTSSRYREFIPTATELV